MPDAPRTVTLSQAKALIHSMAHEQSLLLLSPPGMGKSEIVYQAASAAGLPCRSLLGTQIAPEDVSGVPRIVGERSVFCPPRILLPEDPQPFCLFLDELPACPPDIQKAFYALLLERRLGEHPLPPGTWVVAAGNRAEDRALVRMLSSALVNRLFIINLRVDVKEWLVWAKGAGIRSDILAFILYIPAALMQPGAAQPGAIFHSAGMGFTIAIAHAGRGRRHSQQLHAPGMCFGTVTAEDAALYCAMAEESLADLLPIEEYFSDPSKLPAADTARWFIINRIRTLVRRDEFPSTIPPKEVNQFLQSLPREFCFSLLVDLVERWSDLGAGGAMLGALKEVTGL